MCFLRISIVLFYNFEGNQDCLQCTKLAEELTDLKTQIDRLRKEVIKYKNAVSRKY